MSKRKNSGIPEGEYEVEDILDFRIIPAYDHKMKRYHHIIEYKIKWLGYEETTWEPESNLEHCQKILSNFIKRISEKKSEDEKGKSTGSLNDTIISIHEADSKIFFESVPVSPKSFENYTFEGIPGKSVYGKKRTKKYPKVDKKQTHKKAKSFNGKNVSKEKPNSRNKISPMPKIGKTQAKNKDYFSVDNQENRKKSCEKKKNVPYICYKDLKYLPSFKNFGPSFEEVMYFDARVQKKQISKINDCEKQIDTTDEFSILKNGKIEEKIINNNKFSNGECEIESVDIIGLNRPSSISQENISVDARFNIKKNGGDNKYLNELEVEKLKEYFDYVLPKNFERKSLGYK